MKSPPAVTTRLLLCAVLVLSQAAIAAAQPDAVPVSNDELNIHFRADIQPLAQDGDYHIFLRPNGNRFYPQAYGRSPAELATRGQFIWVHWIVLRENIGDYWADVPDPQFFQPRPLVAPADIDAAMMFYIQSEDAPDPTIELLLYTLHPIPLGAFEGGKWIQVRRLHNNKQIGASIPLYVRRQDWYAWRLGPVWTSLGSDEIVLAPGAEEGSTVIAHRDRGGQQHYALFLAINPWGERDFDVRPPHHLDRVHLLLGSELSDIGETTLGGIAYEVAPGFDIILWGLLSGKVNRLAPGYSLGQTFDGEVATLQVETRETECFWGFAVSADFFNTIFTKGGN